LIKSHVDPVATARGSDTLQNLLRHPAL